jgi:hypothetical protein
MALSRQCTDEDQSVTFDGNGTRLIHPKGEMSNTPEADRGF